MKKHLLLFLLFYACIHRAQVVPNIDWVQSYSDRSTIDNAPTAIDSDNNSYTAGWVMNGSSNKDLIVLKYDSLGTLLWTYQYDNGGGVDYATAIKVDKYQNVYVTGTSYDGTSLQDYYTIALYSNGSLNWAARYDGSGGNDDVASTLVIDTLKNVYVSGTAYNGNDMDIVTVGYDSTGTFLWDNYFDYSGLSDSAKAMVADQNMIYITGHSEWMSSITDIVTLAIDVSGNLNWSVAHDGTMGSVDYGQDIILAGDNIVICGSAFNSSTSEDFVTIKYDNGGNLIWQADYDPGYSAGTELASSLVKDTLGNIAVVGTAMNDYTGLYEYHTVLYDSVGSQLWVNIESIENPSGFNIRPKIAIDSIADHFYICGEKYLPGGASAVLLYQVDPTGYTRWKKTYSGLQGGVDLGVNLTVTGLGEIYVSALCQQGVAQYDINTIKFSQTPVYFPPDPSNEPPASDKLFFENKGQVKDTSNVAVNDIKYYNHSTSPEYYLKNSRISYVFSKSDSTAVDSIERIDVDFFHCNKLADIYNYEVEPTKLNYFLSHLDSTNGIRGIRGSRRLFIPNLYPGVDLQYYSNANGLKYYFIVKPLIGNVNSPQLQIDGAQTTTISSGNLKLIGGLGTVELGNVEAFVVNQNLTTSSVSASWNPLSSSLFGFTVGAYTPTLPLIIMVSKPSGSPASSTTNQNMNYSTFYGGSGGDYFVDVKVSDISNKRFVAGVTNSAAFPSANGLFPWGGGNKDAVLLAYNAGDTLTCATFYGGTGDDTGVGVAIKSNGNAYLVGNTSSTDLPISTSKRPTADQQNANGWYNQSTTSTKSDGFIIELAPDGTGFSHKWSRYFGGIITDGINDVAMDNKDNLYFVGSSNSCNYPKKFSLKNGPSQCQFGTNYDMVVTKMDSTCKLVFSTYYGGDTQSSVCPGCPTLNIDAASTVDVDTLGNIYVGGNIWSATNDLSPVNLTGNTATTSIYNPTLGGSGHVLIRFTPNKTIDFVSEIGRSATTINDIKVLPNQNVLIGGGTQDSTLYFPLKQAGTSFYRSIPLTTKYKGYIAMVDSNLNNLWCTHFNRLAVYGSGQVDVQRIAVGSDNSFYVGGTSYYDSLQFVSSPPSGAYAKTTHSTQEGWISYFSNFSNVYKLEHTHFLGGNSLDGVNGLDVYKKDALYATGFTYSGNYPVAYTSANAALIDNSWNGSQDGFVTRFDLSQVIISVKENTKDGSENAMIRAYPNPVENEFFINTSDIGATKNMKVQVYNMVGQLILEENFSNFNENLIKVDCNNWTHGIYVISVVTDTQKFSGKVIKP